MSLERRHREYAIFLYRAALTLPPLCIRAIERGYPYYLAVPESQESEGSLVVLGELDAEVIEKRLDVQLMLSPQVDVQEHVHHARHVSIALEL